MLVLIHLWVGTYIFKNLGLKRHKILEYRTNLGLISSVSLEHKVKQNYFKPTIFFVNYNLSNRSIPSCYKGINIQRLAESYE